MGVANFGWLVGSPRSEHRLARSHIGVMRRLSGAYVKAKHLVEERWGRARLCIEYPGICLTTEEKQKTSVRLIEWRSAVHR